MKKLLLVGELNQTLSNINEHLSTKFNTQICADGVDMVKGMLKIFEPDMTVICLVGLGEVDEQVMELLANSYSQMPVLLIGTKSECEYYQDYYTTKRFDYIVRPTTLLQLLQKCVLMLKIPASEIEDAPEEGREEESLRKLILAVDDNGMLLRSVKGMLEKKYDVMVATSGKMGLQKAKNKKPDLILLDYEMPEWDGRKTLEELRNDEELKEIPVLFLTAVADKKHITSVLELQPQGYLLKPIDQGTLHDRIEKTLKLDVI